MAIDRQKKQKAKPASVQSQAREEQALELRRGGASYRQIAVTIGISPALAHGLVMRGLERLVKSCEEQAEEIKTIELDRLDRMTLALWPRALKGDVVAIDRILKLMDQRAKYLGLYAPTKLAGTNPEGTEERPMALVAMPAQMGMDEWARTFAKRES